MAEEQSRVIVYLLPLSDRFQDIHWYNRDQDSGDEEEVKRKKKAEIQKVKDAEEDALSLAL